MGNRASMKGVNPKGQGHNSDDASSSPQVSKLDIQSPTSLDVPTTKLDLHKSPSEDGLTEITFKMNTEGSKLTLDDFELLCVIGRGSFGKVLQVKKKDNGKIYAMKILNKKHLIARKQVAHTKTERKVLQSITHPFIVNLIYAFQTEAKLYMVLEFFNGGELFFHLKNQGKFNDERASFYAAQVVLAFEHLHKRNIIYRDLKPENVLLDDQGYVKITDFGLSKEMTSPTELTHTFCGTPEYLAPEVILGNGYGQPIDWWSLGALTFEMLTGLPPYYDESTCVMYEKILNQEIKYPSYISPKAKAFMERLLAKDWKKRLGSNGDAAEVKQDPYFAHIDWQKLIEKKLPPPYKPNVSSPIDLSNIDDEFKSESPKDTPVQTSKLGQKVQFSNFTYEGNNQMNNSGADWNFGRKGKDSQELNKVLQ